MPEVRILSDRVANQIAAGEVIERPVAVVKELVENSLDAGATRVEIEFRNGGKSLIRVKDNGCGMSKADAELALKRHGTSKIRDAEDLRKILSFGFRGEALPSIASVSKFTLRTREASATHGTEIHINGGEIVHTRESGTPVGTEIEVAHLFNSVPARRKFLKTDNTEAAHIVNLCRLLAVAHADVSFMLQENGRTVFRSPVCPNLRERVGEIFGRQISDNLIEIKAEDPKFKLGGLVGKPGYGRSSRQEMVTYVNRRPVDSRALGYALIEAYHTYIPKGRYPLSFLFLEMNPDYVDVNVHPAKREVRFRNESALRSFVMLSLMDRLREASQEASVAHRRPAPPSNGAAPARVSAPTPQPARQEHSAPPRTPRAQPEPPPQTRTEATPKSPPPKDGPAAQQEAPAPKPPPVRREPGPERVPQSPPRAESDPSSLPPGPADSVPPEPPESGRSLVAWHYKGFIHGQYALFENSAGVVMLSIRCATERVLYERMRNLFALEQPRSQNLLFPVSLELDPVTTGIVESHREFLSSNGFEIAPFGKNFYRLEALPEWLEPTEGEDFVRDLLEKIKERGLRPSKAQLLHGEMARIAATRATRSATTPTPEEMNALVAELFLCENPITSPSGCPTFFEITKTELEKKFGK